MIVISDNRNPNYNGNISTTNGLYRVESSNLSTYSSTLQSLTGTYSIPVTFANAGNCMGVVLPLIPTAPINRPLTVTLKQSGTARASKTLTALEIFCSTVTTDTFGCGFITPFKFDTPYAVNTTAGIWTIEITSAVGTGNWNLRQAAAGVPSYAVWCDNQATFTSNQDQFIAMDDLYLDATATLRGALQSGDTINAIAGWVCTGISRNVLSVSRLQWTPNPTTSYKVTVSGFIMMGATSGFRAGTPENPIPASAMGWLEFITAPVGTNTGNATSGFTALQKLGNCNANIFIYGEIPSIEDTELSQAEASGQNVIHTEIATGWQAGDIIAIGRQTVRGNTDQNTYTVQSVDGTLITLTTTLTAARSINASVIKANGYGFKLTSTSTGGTYHRLVQISNFVLSGVQCVNHIWDITGTLPYNPVSNVAIPMLFSHCSSFSTAITYVFPNSSSSGQGLQPAGAGMFFEHVNYHKCSAFGSMTVGNGQGSLTATDNIFINQDAYGACAVGTAGIWNYSRNKHEGSTNSQFQASGVLATFRDNKFWGINTGGSTGLGALRVQSLYLTTDWGGNSYDNNVVSINFASGNSFGNKCFADEFSQQIANNLDIWNYYNSLHQMVFENCKGNITTAIASNGIVGGAYTSLVKVNQVEGNDRIEKTEGTLYKSGDGLADTTKHSEKYALKFVPRQDYVNPLKWEQKMPTENIQNKDMMVGVWVNISNAAYWATTYQLPRLIVNYDNGTIAYAQAAQATGWQFIFVPFTPQTTYGELTVSITGKTSATEVNAPFYVTEISVLYPAGHNISLGKMNSWANGLPLMPSISTTISASDVWAASPAQFGANTAGALVKTIDTTTNRIQATTDFLGG